ncbi:mechanosensitive ion channel family protein [Agarivorans gilvus]|uniref:Small-conductance mechanosensitive channel n=1 Tax=Agarivorans gilvus TaxID=680279 RepID=A0ABQ1I4P0_9ALTE|nr:mechanosensitive ion channel family protein [Agarivorans gilvus]GGB11967.1 hypothetical protein GCM10007414_26840 [Agarivorans gilvus]
MDNINLNNFWSLIQQKLQNWVEDSITLLPNIVLALVVVLVFLLLAKVLGHIIKNLTQKVIDSKEAISLLSSIVKIVIASSGLFIALDLVGLKGTVTSLLAGAGIVGLAIGFAFQDMTENLISGISMSIRKPFKIGDIIQANGVFGSVEAINLRNTIVSTFSGQREIIPNKLLFRNILTNFSANRIRKIEIPVGISYADDPERAAKLITDALNKHKFIYDPQQTAVYADGFNDSSINLLVWLWIAYPGEVGFMEAKHQAVITIKQTLNEAGIVIPFPIRTMDFAIKGGEDLSTMLNHSRFQLSRSSQHQQQTTEQ